MMWPKILNDSPLFPNMEKGSGNHSNWNSYLWTGPACAGSTPIPRCTLAAHRTFPIAASLPTVYTTCGRNSSPIPFYSTYLTNRVTQLFEVDVKEFEVHLRGKLPGNLAQGDLHHSVCIMQLHKVGPGLPHFFAPQLLWSINLLCNFGRLFCYSRLGMLVSFIVV